MKNGKKKPINEKLKALLYADLKRYSPVMALGMLSAIVLRRGPSLSEFLGSFILASLLIFFLYRDVFRYKPRYLEKKSMLILLGMLVIGTVFSGRVGEYVFYSLSEGIKIASGVAVFAMPVPAGAMLVTLLFDFHTAILFSFVVSILTGLWQADPAIAVYAFIGSLTAAFSVIRCKRRSAILLGGSYVFAANLVTALAILLWKGELFTAKALVAGVFASFSAVSVVALVSLLLPLLEYLFKITTDISLLELLDLEQPLMKNLMIEAPGTYHHSIIVGNLVEAVADSVGVNPLLARVAAYYHDIGKAKMPEYFIENTKGVSKHDKLSPHMSSMILVSHVKEGVELAKQHKLPETIIDIIEQHHGTSLITYFYEKAREQPGSEDLSEETYRYPGPRPQSRTSALIMMADAVEAASRVLHDPTPSRIEALVERIINHIFLTGQLDECELTLRDIYDIKKRFTHILTGILHKRIDYPGFDFDGNEGSHKRPPKEEKTKHPADRERLPEGARAAASSKG